MATQTYIICWSFGGNLTPVAEIAAGSAEEAALAFKPEATRSTKTPRGYRTPCFVDGRGESFYVTRLLAK